MLGLWALGISSGDRAALLGLLLFSIPGLGGFPHWQPDFLTAFPCRSLRGRGPTLLLSCLPQAGPIYFPQKFPSKRLLRQRKAAVVLPGGARESVVNSFVNGTFYEARTTDPFLLRALRRGAKTTRVSMSSQEQGLRFRDIHVIHLIRRLVHLTNPHWCVAF